MRVMLHALLIWAAWSMAEAACPNHFSVGNSYLPYCTNGKAGRAVFVIHGVDRNPETYISYLADLPTRVIAPDFQADGPGIYWSSNGWSRGDNSSDQEHVSSYDVLDLMVRAFNGIAVVGHSGGGQFVARYAAGTRISGLTYIAANAGTYMWLDASRPVSLNCPGYNDYKYGLDDPNSYMARGVAADYAGRSVTYLLGGNDTDVDGNLDTSCAANRQGANRLERGLNFYAHLQAHFGYAAHQAVIVPGVGHSASAMMEVAREYLPPLERHCGSCHDGSPVALRKDQPGTQRSSARRGSSPDQAALDALR